LSVVTVAASPVKDGAESSPAVNVAVTDSLLVIVRVVAVLFSGAAAPSLADTFTTTLLEVELGAPMSRNVNIKSFEVPAASEKGTPDA